MKRSILGLSAGMLITTSLFAGTPSTAHPMPGASWVAINPQPLPPRVYTQSPVSAPAAALATTRPMSSISWGALNPQPLPPRVLSQASH